MTTYILEGKVTPYVRMTHNGKYRSGAAGTYLASKEALSWQYLAQRNGAPLYPTTASLRVDILITRPDSLHHCDIDNEAKALLDAANGLIYDDDRCIDELHVTRLSGPTYRTRVIITELPVIPSVARNLSSICEIQESAESAVQDPDVSRLTFHARRSNER